METVAYRRFPHNFLEAGLKVVAKRVAENAAAEKRCGISYDVFMGIIYAAFTIEANANFVGNHLLKGGWPERASITEKLKLVYAVTKLEYDNSRRPLQTIEQLIRLRNDFAHAKPEIGTVTRELPTDSEPDLFADLKLKQMEHVNPQFLLRACEDVFALRDTLYAAAGISHFDSTNTVSGSTSVQRSE